MGLEERARLERGSWLTLNGRRAVRAADGAGLENQWAAMPRGFESHALRQQDPDGRSEGG